MSEQDFGYARRFDVRMSPELAEQLNELADQNNMTRVEVFRRAIGLYRLVKGAEKNGEEIIIRSPATEKHIIGI